ncbi:MAG: histidinol dehydrogenase [Acidobacteriota bacterium]
MSFRFRRLTPETLHALKRPTSSDNSGMAERIVGDIRRGGQVALRRWSRRLGDLQAGEPLVRDSSELHAALVRLAPERRALLERVAGRIESFARAQRDALREIDVAVPGGRAGHWLAPVETAGCYAPGGRFPLPSSVLMTAVTARAAGVRTVWIANPRPTPEAMAAAALAEADGLLAAGGAQAVAALAVGAGPVPPCDVVVGPGGAWASAAKRVIAGSVGIDFIAGPSELVVLADLSADPETIAADLLAQAEHDPLALPILVATEADLVRSVEQAMGRRLADLPTREVARRALANGAAVLARDIEKAVAACDALAPEHLQIVTRQAPAVARRCRHYGAIFIGPHSAEVVADYGAGPNHTLPTGEGARFTGGLSVFHFLRVRTWLAIDDPGSAAGLYDDAAAMAAMEGLEGHRRAALLRRRGSA